MSQQETADQNSLDLLMRRAFTRARSDVTFRARLLEDANAALSSLGLALPAGVTIKVVEDTETVRHYILPPQSESELSDEFLEAVVGGKGGDHFQTSHFQTQLYHHQHHLLLHRRQFQFRSFQDK